MFKNMKEKISIFFKNRIDKNIDVKVDMVINIFLEKNISILHPKLKNITFNTNADDLVEQLLLMKKLYDRLYGEYDIYITEFIPESERIKTLVMLSTDAESSHILDLEYKSKLVNILNEYRNLKKLYLDLKENEHNAKVKKNIYIVEKYLVPLDLLCDTILDMSNQV